MRLKPYHMTLPALFMGICMSMTSIAQEDKTQPDDIVVKEIKADPLPSSESEARPSKPLVTPIIQRDSSAVKTSIKSGKVPDKNSKSDDPLTFNFLYYIIEKFKLSDIIE